MIFIFSNIRYGHPKLWKFQDDFFSDFNMMMYKTNSNDNEIFIRGDLFYNTKNPTFEVLNGMKKILFHLNQFAKVYVIKSHYLFPLFLGDLSENDLDDDIENKLGDVSLFHFSKDSSNIIGYNIFKNDKLAFIENKVTPRFVEYIINSVEDLENVVINNDFIDLTINSELLNNQQFKNKIDIFLNNNKFNNVFYTEQINIEDKVKLDSKNINIRNILIDNIDDELKEDLQEIFIIYDQKTID